MARAAQLDVEFTTSGVDTVNKAIDSVNVKLGAFGAGMMLVGSRLTDSVTRPIMGFLGDAYMGAASLEQAVGKVESVFGDAATGMLRWAQSSDTAYGISEKQALSMAGTYGQILQAQGMSIDQSAEYSQWLIQLASDMTAFTDVSSDRTSLALRSALTGEYQSLKDLGIVLTAAEVEQEALNIATEQGSTEVTEYHRQLARMAIIQRQTTNMQGQFAREAEGASGSLMTLNAQWENLTDQLGQVMIPIGTKVTEILSKFVSGLMALPAPVRTITVGIAALAAAIGPLLSVVGAMSIGIAALPAAFGAVTAAVSAMGAAFIAFLANPIVLAGIATIGAGILAYKTNFMGFGDLVRDVVGWVEKLFAALQLVFGTPSSKTININSQFDDGELYIKATTLEDGTKKWNIIEDETGGTFGDIIDSYENSGGEVFVLIQPEGGGDTFWAKADLDTGKVVNVDLDTAWSDPDSLTTQIARGEATGSEYTVFLTPDGTQVGVELDRIENEEQGTARVLIQPTGGGDPFWSTVQTDMNGSIKKIDSVDIAVNADTGKLSEVETLAGTINGWVDKIKFGWWLLNESIRVTIGFLGDVKAGIEGVWDALTGKDNPTGSHQDTVMTPGGVAVPVMNDPEGSNRTPRLPGQSQSTQYDRNNSPAFANLQQGHGLGRLFADAAVQTGLFDKALTKLNMTTLVTNGSINKTASTVPMYTRSTEDADRATGGMSSSMGRSFGSMALAALTNFTQMKNTVSTNASTMSSEAETSGTEMSTGLTSWMLGARLNMVAGLALMVGTIKGVATTGYDAGYYAGGMISRGFAAGMNSQLGSIVAASNAMVAAASRAVIAKAMIASPSKLFRQFGTFVGEGFELGILGKVRDVARASEQLIDTGVGHIDSYRLPERIGAGTVIDQSTHIVENRYFSESDLARMLQMAEEAPAKGAALSARLLREAGDLAGGMI